MPPNIIDSLFLELGIDTAKFSKDQQKSLAMIADFEKRAKKSGKNSADAIKTVGEAFRDLASGSRIGASAVGIENMSKKLTDLGKSAQVAGVLGGGAAEALGMLLRPTSLGIAAVGLLGYEMWDLNKQMTATNATIYRQAQLSGMNAANLWDWGEAARTVGANPQEVTSGIAALQMSITGMGIGAGNATPQLIALARLGVPFDFKKGADIPTLMAKVHAMAAASNFDDLGALRALTLPAMNDAMFNIATNKEYDPNALKEKIKGQEAVGTGETLSKSLKSQVALGELGIAQDVLAEVAYGGEQGLLQAMVELLTSILSELKTLVDFVAHPVRAVRAVVNAASYIPEMLGHAWDAIKGATSPTQHRVAWATKELMGRGLSAMDAAAAVGNLAWESGGLNPNASNQGHYGLGQWDAKRQKLFAKKKGYRMDDKSKGEYRQALDQLDFLVWEMQGPEKPSADEMSKAKNLLAKTNAFMKFYERPGKDDHTFNQRFAYAQMADAANARSGSSVVVTNDTDIHQVNLYTSSNDPAAHAAAFSKGISSQPLLHPLSQGTVALATRGSQ